MRSPHSSLFTGFSFCHPMYDDKHMLIVVQHATASTLNDQEAIAIFLLLPKWTGSNAHACTKPALTTKMFATFLEISQRQKCATCHSSTSKAKHHPCQKQHQGMQVPVVKKKAYQGATCNKPPILVKNKNETYQQRQSGIL